MKKIKLGIIGCGLAARNLHYPALMELKDKFEITAVSNHTEPKAKEFSALLGGVPYFPDYKDLLQRSDIEAVDIALPINLNYQATKDALDAGKHVFIEKPLAANLAEAEEMLKFPKEYKTVMLLAENFRYKKLYGKIKEIISSSKIGKPFTFIWYTFDNVQENVYGQTDWRKHHKYPGGFITDGGVHSIAALRLIFGEILPVSAFVQSINPNAGKVDTFNFQMKFESGVTGSLHLFFSTPYEYENRLIIFGDKGSIEANRDTLIIKAYSSANLMGEKKEEREEISSGSGFKEEFEDFYSAIREGTKVRSTFEEGYRDLKTIIKALNMSGKNG
jgi:predicted dehydrogenase